MPRPTTAQPTASITPEAVGTAAPAPRFCVLLDSPVTFNGRVQRTVGTLSALGPVLLVTSGGSPSDQDLFDDAVEVRTTDRPEPRGLRKFFLLHRQTDHLADSVLADGRGFDEIGRAHV